MNAETRRRVQEAARAFGYEPNQSGRSLRQGRTGAIAFIMEVGQETSDESAAFFMSVHLGVQSVIHPAGLDYMVLLTPEGQDAAAFMTRTIGRRLADAFVLSATKRSDPRIELLETRGIPFVSLGRSGSGRSYDWVDLDFDALARRSVRLLWEAGHRRIAITVPHGELNFADVYLAGYRAALADLGLPYDQQLVIRAPLHAGGGTVAARTLLERKPRADSILLINDLMAQGLYAELRAAGLEPGRDVGVVGSRRLAQNEQLTPALTSFAMPLSDLGRTIGLRLIAKLPGLERPMAAPTGSLCPAELILGRSHLRDSALDSALDSARHGARERVRGAAVRS